QLQRPERQVVPVAAEIAHRAAAEIPPAIPFRTGEVDRMERPRRCRAQPEIPVETRRNRLLFLRTFGDVDNVLVLVRSLLALQAPRARHPDVGLAHRTDDTALDQFDDAAIVLAGVNLNAHLRGDLALHRLLANLARLPDVVCERLLAVDVLVV